jgi:prepilin-type N-terminal cleavage/methylation domain-containing protein
VKIINPKKILQGFTLIEIMVVLVILAIATAAMVPMLSSGDAEKLDLAVTEVANAIRFTRAESMRRGGPIQGLTFDSVSHNVSLNNYNLTTVGLNLKAYIDATTPVISPLDKKLYSLNLPTLPNASGAKLGAVMYATAAQTSPQVILFDAQGVPRYLGGASQLWYFVDTELPILIPVTLSGQTKNIRIDGTGRIRIL